MSASDVEAAAVAAFKEQLGIHSSQDAQFGWIAEVGLKSPLPPRYTSHADEECGFIYYIDHDRQSSSWENPLVPYLRRIVEIGRSYLEQPSDSFFDDERGKLWHQHKHQLDCWQGPFMDGNGKQYFVNAAEEVSTWQDPRVDAQYIFELESGLLASLEEVLPGAGQRPEDAPNMMPGGAEVLTLDGGTTARLNSSWRRTGLLTLATPSAATLKDIAQQTAQVEAVSTLNQMSSTAKRLQGLQEDEEEAQRLAFAKKLKERRQRQSQSKGHTQNQVHQQNGSPAKALVRPTGPPPAPNSVATTSPSEEFSLVLAEAKAGFRRRPAPLLGEVQEGVAQSFKPPNVPPSPLAGNVPTSPMSDKGARRAAQVQEAHQVALLADLELKGNGPATSVGSQNPEPEAYQHASADPELEGSGPVTPAGPRTPEPEAQPSAAGADPELLGSGPAAAKGASPEHEAHQFAVGDPEAQQSASCEDPDLRDRGQASPTG